MHQPTSGVPAALLTPEEVAPLVHKSPRWLKDQARAHRIPHRRMGRNYRFSQEDVEEIIASTAVPAASTADKASA